MEERLDLRTTALVIFDMQKGQFNVTDPERQRWLKESNILANCVDLVKTAREAGIQVMYVRNNRRPDGLDQKQVITDQSLAAPPGGGGGAPNPQQWEIVDELKPEPQDIVIDKIRMGAFSSTTLDTILRARGVETFILCGVRTTVGVETTVRDGRDLGYNIVLTSDCTGGIAPEDHRWVLEKIFPMFCRVRSLAQVKGMLGQ
jgi:nicotinamidase-related amidase